MGDDEAIALFEADGGIAREWHCVDESVRLHYRLATRENPRVATSDDSAAVARDTAVAFNKRGNFTAH